MASIRKREGKRGTTYQVRASTPAGYVYENFATLKEARAYAQNIGEVSRSPDGRLSVFEAVDRWLDICEKVGRDGREKVEPQTLKEYKRRALIMKRYDWPKTIGQLETSDIVTFRTWLLEKHNRDVARRVLSSLHSVLIEMKLQGLIKSDPAAGVTVKSGGRYEDEDSEVAVPTDGEVKAILQAADKLAAQASTAKSWARYRPMIYLAAFSGMRPSEYRGLPWANLGEESVVVRQRADATGIIGPVKSKAGRRTIYLPRMVTDMIFAWKEQCSASPYDLVFPTSTGEPMLLSNIIRRAWAPLMKEAGLLVLAEYRGKQVLRPKYTLNALRHYFASKLIERNRDLKYIQKVMGHSRIELTFNVYGHLISGNEKSYRETAEEMLTNVLGTRSMKPTKPSRKASKKLPA